MVLLPLHRDLRDFELLGLAQKRLRLRVLLVAGGAKVECEGISVKCVALVAEGVHGCGWLYYYMEEGSL